MLTRNEALALLKEYGLDQSLMNHSLESEAVMRGLAEKLGRDAELWGLTGLLHDLDYQATKDNPELHGLKTRETLEDKLPQEALDAIGRHAFELNNAVPPSEEFDFALRCGESVTGLVHANAMVRPTGMDGMKAKSLKKKMKEKAFAASVSRDEIRECEKIGLELGEFFQVAIAAINGIKSDVGLG